MAKVTITIEDMPDGTVNTVVTPKVSDLLQKMVSGTQLSAAEGFAFTGLNAIRKAAKRPGPLPIIVPKLFR